MKPEIKKLWVEALRSGKYEQGRGALCREGRHCCLGVLADLSPIEPVKVLDKGATFLEFDGETQHLPPSIQKWSGVTAHGTTGLGIHSTLVELNDFDRYTFDQIADIIEKQL